MDEHDDDLASEVIEGEEIESETFDPDDDESVQGEEKFAESEEEGGTEDDSEM